jgi:hypothetical protein
MFREIEPPQRRPSPIVYRALPLMAVVAWALYVFWSWAGGDYFGAMHRLGIPAFEIPFFDLHTPLSWLECAEKGIDVFHANPCQPGYVVSYGPIILALAGSGLSTADSLWLGVTVSGIALISILWLLRPTTLGQSAICAAAIVSSSVMFAAERANLDIIIFLWLLASAALLCGSRAARLGGYALLLIIGLVKFYPLAALGIAVRERTRIFLTICAISAVSVAVYLAVYGPEIRLALTRIPVTISPTDFNSFGILDFAITTVRWTTGIALTKGDPWYNFGRVALLLLGAGLSYRVKCWFQTLGVTLGGTRFEITLFILGALVISFCFFFGSNISYRCVLLVLCVPLLLTSMSAPSMNAISKGVAGTQVVLMIVVLWAPAIFYNIPYEVSVIHTLAYGVARFLVEVAKWAVVISLTAALWQVLFESPLLARGGHRRQCPAPLVVPDYPVRRGSP